MKYILNMNVDINILVHCFILITSVNCNQDDDFVQLDDQNYEYKEYNNKDDSPLQVDGQDYDYNDYDKKDYEHYDYDYTYCGSVKLDVKDYDYNEEYSNDGCLWGYILVDGVCQLVRDTWSCFGVKQLKEIPCKGKCYPEYALVFNGTCVKKWETWKCNGGRQLKGDPCGNECPEHYCLEDGMCIYKIDFWNCNGKCQPNNVPCNNTCVENRCLFNGKCTSVRNHLWSCGSQCQSIEDPCNGICAKDYDHYNYLSQGDQVYQDGHDYQDYRDYDQEYSNVKLSNEYVNVDNNICVNEVISWECNGTVKRVNESCNQQCPINRCLNNDEMNCAEAPHDQYSCGDKCQSWRIPCNKECLQPLVLVEGACYSNMRQSLIWKCGKKQQFLATPCKDLCRKDRVLINNVCEKYKKTWNCNGNHILLKTPCDGECPANRTLVKESCLTDNEFWMCDHIKQPVSEPCYGLCIHITQKKYFDTHKDTKYIFGFRDECFNFTKFEQDGGVYLTDYINCEDKCLLREHSWECNGRCISKKKSCDRKCYNGLDLHTYYGKKSRNGVECFPRIDFQSGENINEISKEGEISFDQFGPVAGGEYIWFVSAVTTLSLASVEENNDLEPVDYLHLTSPGPSSQVHPDAMGVYQKSKVKHNNFHMYYHTDRVYFIFVDKQGFWAANNNIQSETFTLYYPGIIPTQEYPPVFGWRYRDHEGNWQEDSRMQLVAKTVREQYPSS